MKCMAMGRNEIRMVSRIFSLSLTLARLNLLLAAPSVPVHSLTGPTTEAK